MIEARRTQSFYYNSIVFADTPCMKRVYKTNRRRYTGQQPGTKSGRRPGDKTGYRPRVNRGFVPPSVYIGFPLFVLPKDVQDIVLDALEGNRDGCLLGEPIRRRPVLPCPALPRPLRRAPPRPDPPMIYPDFGLHRFTLHHFSDIPCMKSVYRDN